MNIYLILILLVNSLASELSQAQTFTPTSNYVNSKVLVDNQYALFWNYTTNDITAEIHVKANGWVGFGLSSNGGMNGGDVFVAWIDENNKVNFTDRHIVDRSVLIDKSQDWKLLYGVKQNGFTIIKFTRLINTCDPDNQDLVIEPGAPKCIFAWSNSLPIDGKITQHENENRGVAAIQLISALNDKSTIRPDDNLKTHDFVIEADLPGGFETVYWCQMFKLPTEILNKKKHLLKTETFFKSGNEMLVHHWLLYQCDSSYENEYLPNNNNQNPLPGNCFDGRDTLSPNKPNTWNSAASHCLTTSLIWAVGGDTTQYFPDGLGYPLGGSDREFTYFYVQMHYNNPSLKPFHDNSSIRLSVTDNYRETEVGVYSIGASSTWLAIIVPPLMEKFQLDFHCRKDCLNKWYNGSGVTVFAVAPHTHLLGAEVYTNVIRNGKEIAIVDRAKDYDFNYQYINFLQNPIKLEVDDELRTTCIYNSKKRSNYTFGGLSTMEEMCIDFLFYYPKRANIGSCFFINKYEDWIELFLNLNKTGSMVLTHFPPTFESIEKDLESLKTNQEVKDILVNFFQTKDNIQMCLTDEGYKEANYAKSEITPLSEQNSCKKENSDNSGLSTLANNFILLFSLIFAIFK